jgi:hypothetical protein
MRSPDVYVLSVPLPLLRYTSRAGFTPKVAAKSSTEAYKSRN